MQSCCLKTIKFLDCFPVLWNERERRLPTNCGFKTNELHYVEFTVPLRTVRKRERLPTRRHKYPSIDIDTLCLCFGIIMKVILATCNAAGKVMTKAEYALVIALNLMQPARAQYQRLDRV